MSAESPAIEARKLQKRLQRRRAIRDSWPILVWLAMLALAIWAYNFGGEFHRMRGVVSQQINYVSSPETGGLVPIPEDLAPRDEQGNIKTLNQGDWVRKGEVVAKLDDRLIEQEIRREIELADLQLTEQRQKTFFLLDELQDELFEFRNQLQVVSDAIEAQKVRKEQVEALMREGRATDVEVATVDAEIAGLEIQKKGIERQIENAEEQIGEGQDLIAKLREQATLLTDRSQSESLKFLEAQKEQTVIRASNTGRIQKVWKQPGDVVRAGDPIMEILVEEDKKITALIPEEYALTLDEQQEVWVSPVDGERNFQSARVVSMAPGLTQVADLASPIRGRMIRGRLVELGNLEGAEDWIPGSAVIISLDEPGWVSALARFVE